MRLAWLLVAAFVAPVVGLRILQAGLLPCRSRVVPSHCSRRRQLTGRLFASTAEDGVSLASLTGHEDDAAFLSAAVQEWLDLEWIPQEVHQEIGSKVGEIYVQSREEKDYNDLTSVMMAIGNGLESVDMKDAFVGPWDVANAASDFLMERLGRETVPCAVTAPASHFNSESVGALMTMLRTSFARYRWISAALEDESWDNLSAVVGLVLGFRINDDGSGLSSARVEPEWAKQCPGNAPPRLDPSAPFLRDSLFPSLPEEGTDDHEVLEDVLKSAFGEEMLEISKREEDPEFAARRTIVLWLVNQNFLSDDSLVS